MNDDQEALAPQAGESRRRLFATEEEIRADERRQVCKEEGHNQIETTPLGAVDEHLRCRRCGARWTRPRSSR